MAVARSMTAHHWISDSLGIFGPVALIAYWLYFDFLKVPQQRAYFRRNKKLPEMPRLWELKLCGWGFLVILGLICWFWGSLCATAISSLFAGVGTCWSCADDMGIPEDSTTLFRPV